MADNYSRDDITSRYQRARSLYDGFLGKTVAFNTTVYPTWISDTDCFWYERETRDGKEYRLVDAAKATNEVAFNHQALAAALADAVEEKIDAQNLSINKIEMHFKEPFSTETGVDRVQFVAFDCDWEFDCRTKTCCKSEKPHVDNSTYVAEIVSPNGQYTAFTRDNNLWIRDNQNGQERALTNDGEECYVYAAVGTAWGSATDFGLQARWSADSKKLLTVQRDTRRVKTLPIVHHVPRDGGIRPSVEDIKIAFPGDEHIETLRLLSIDIVTGRQQEANYRQIPDTRNGNGFFSANLGWWSINNRHAYFVDMERDYKTVRVVEFDTDTGETRKLLEETSDTQISLMLNADERPAFVTLPETNELLWFSERSGWAHLYLYDLKTGARKNTVTEGDWLVRHVVSVDCQRREAFIQTAGRVADRDPYYRDLCRVHLDTGELTTVVSTDHEINVVMQSEMTVSTISLVGLRDIRSACGVSPTGNYAVVTQSRADDVPVSFLLDRDGEQILTLEVADVSGLPSGWQWPEPVKLLAADGKTDIYGLVFRPSDFSPDQSYPIVTHVFSTPELPIVSKGSFSNGSMFMGLPYTDAAALAELGFIVVQIDGRGTPFRHKGFNDEHYGCLEAVSNIDDHVAGIQQLVERYPYMDIQRVGITNHVSGGSGSIQGLLKHPEFYSVAIGSIIHDSRLLSAPMWGELFEGSSGPQPDCEFPEELVDQLQGKLLLIHGMLDTSCPSAIVFRLVEALQKANKDFDLLLLPNLGHEPSGYLTRRSWDYLVQHLMKVNPPKEFKLTTWALA